MRTAPIFTRALLLIPASSLLVALSGCHDQLPTVIQGPPTIIIQPDAFASDTVAGVEVHYRPPAPGDWKTVVTDAGIVNPWQWLVPGVIGGVIYASNVEKLQSLVGAAWIDTVLVMPSGGNTPQSDIIPWGVDSTGAREVQNTQGFTAAGVKVAIIDNGIDCNHPDLVDRYVGGTGFEQGYGACDSGDDGTKAAGVIAASINNSGVIGMAPQVSLYSFNACHVVSGQWSCPTLDIVHALDAAVDSGAQVVSISLASCGANTTYWNAADSTDFQAAYNAGVLIVASAGDGTGVGCDSTDVGYPARYPSVIAVSAVEKNGAYLSGAQYGPQIELAAPDSVLSDAPGGDTALFAGTSASAPHVAGAAALVIQAYTSIGSNPDPATIRARLDTESFPMLPHHLRSDYYGYGILRADRAAVFEPSISAIDGSTTVTPGTYTYSASLRPWGQSPFQYQWHIQYDTVDYTTRYSSSSDLTYTWPSGYYDATLTATPKDAWGRVGSPGTITVVVCNSTQNRPDTQWGCNPPPK